MSNDLEQLQATRKRLHKTYSDSLLVWDFMWPVILTCIVMQIAQPFPCDIPRTSVLAASQSFVDSFKLFSSSAFGVIGLLCIIFTTPSAFIALMVRPKLRRVENEIRVLEILDGREADSSGFVTLPAGHKATAHTDGFAGGRYEDAYCDPPPSRL